MSLKLCRAYDLTIKDKSKLLIKIWVESKHNKLNSNTSTIVPLKELDKAVKDVLDSLEGKSLDDIREFKYVDHTLEVITIRLWELIDENMPYQARLVQLRVHEGKQTFVEYTLDENRRAKRRTND